MRSIIKIMLTSFMFVMGGTKQSKLPEWCALPVCGHGILDRPTTERRDHHPFWKDVDQFENVLKKCCRRLKEEAELLAVQYRKDNTNQRIQEILFKASSEFLIWG
jgi:hypothetical protein